jgi:ubiquitin-like-conjugating enzyme ATG3
MDETDQAPAAPASSRLGTLGLKAWQYGRNAALSAAEYMTPVLVESQFATKGVLTPEEFVAAGDMLVLRCPTWQWQAGDPAKARPFLPPGKQFLLTRNVPCQKRATALALGADEEEAISMRVADGEGDEEDWVSTHKSFAATAVADDDAPDMVVVSEAFGRMDVKGGGDPGSGSGAAASAATSAASAAEAGLEEFGAVEADDPSALDADDFEDLGDESSILRTRTYDVSITYDKYYQCARVWLYGYSEARQPLSQPEILQDISVDHALKTVTLEAHPHISTGAGLHASIHPCKHAQVMQKLTSELARAGREVRAEQYLFLFLKFISSVCPTIEYDYTLDA